MFRADVRNKRNKTAADIAHNVQISKMIQKCRGKSKHLDYFDSLGRRTMHTTYFDQNSAQNSFVKDNDKFSSLKFKNTSTDKCPDVNANSCQADFEVQETRRAISLLFKAIKMGDISYISDYFGVAILKPNSNAENTCDIDDVRSSIWYTEDFGNGQSEDNPALSEKNEMDQQKEEKVMRNVDIFGPEGLSPLHEASRVGSIVIVHFLLSVGASPQLRYKLFLIV